MVWSSSLVISKVINYASLRNGGKSPQDTGVYIDKTVP